MSPAVWERHHKDPDHRGHRPVQPRAKKDTRSWCKGKVGVPHQPVVNRQSFGQGRPCRQPPAWFSMQFRRGNHRQWWCYHQVVCRICGKILVHQLDWRFCPDLPATLKELTR